MKLSIRYRKNKHQKEFHDDLTSKFLHLSTGFGGGKTHALVMKAIQLSFLNKHAHGGLVAPSYAEFKKDILPLFEEILDSNKVEFDYHGTDHYFTFPWTKKRLYVVSGLNKIRGPNWGYAVINELTLIPLVRYKEVIGRVRVRNAKYPQIASVGTPEGMASEYYDYMIENPRDDFKEKLRIIYGDTRDNAQNLTEDFLEDLESSYDSVMQEAYIRGHWINMTTDRFYYSFDSHKNVDNSIEPSPYSAVHISMDFNVNPMTCVAWNYDGRNLKAFDEITLNDADTNKMCQAMKARGYTPENTIIYPDPAGKARSTKGQPDTEILKAHGYTEVRVKNKAPMFRARQLNVNNLLEKEVIKINAKKCPGLYKDFQAVEQDQVTLEKKKDNPKLTHYSDGMDYMCDILYPFKGKNKESSVEKFR